MTNDTQTLHRAQSRRPVFQLWGWAMLFVVLLCSAAASGQPRTRIVGSAFDPTTTSVALNPKQPRMAAKAAKSAKGKLPGKDAAIWAPPAAIAGEAAWAAQAALPAEQPAYVAFTGVAVRRVPVHPLGARAPPRV